MRPGQAVDLRTRGEDLSVLRAGGDGTDHCGRSGDGQHMWSVPNGSRAAWTDGQTGEAAMDAAACRLREAVTAIAQNRSSGNLRS